MVDSNNKILCFDISNVLYRTFFANKNEEDSVTAGLAHHQALTTLHKYYRDIKPNRVIMTFDRPNWREEYTKSSECISKRIYKGHRRQTMTPAERAKYERFKLHLKDFESLMREHTSIVCLAADMLEADDLMAGVVRHFSDSELYLISADKDLMQLLGNQNVHLVDPANDKKRSLVEYNDDANYFMYQKCIRGDAGDNVQSAYPKIRSTRIQKAYQDPFEHEAIMNHTWTDQNKVEYRVGDLFEENKLLMDLNQQPDVIKELIEETIVEGLQSPGKYDHFRFLRFCGKYELKKISENVNNYIPLLSS